MHLVLVALVPSKRHIQEIIVSIQSSLLRNIVHGSWLVGQVLEPALEVVAKAGTRVPWVAPMFQILLELKVMYDARTELGKELDSYYDLMEDVCKVLTTIYSGASDSKKGDELFERCFGELRRDVQEMEKLHKEYNGSEFATRMKRMFQAKKMKEKLVEHKKNVKSSMELGILKQIAYQMQQNTQVASQTKEMVEQLKVDINKVQDSIDESNARMRQLTENVSGTVISDLAGVVDPTRMVGRESVWWLC